MNTLLTILLSLTMTWTVYTKSAVSSSGDVPAAVSASYQCTYQKGTVRANDTALLRISGLKGMTVYSAKLYLRSNKSSGAGTITITADSEQIWQKEGDYKSWFGQYDNSNYQSIGWIGEKTLQDGTLEIQLEGTVNSLHISCYEISYSLPAPHTVTLMNGAEIYEEFSESVSGAGITLPKLADHDSLQFAGWSESEFWAISNPPAIISAGQTYYPASDITLWGVWRYVNPEDTAYVKKLKSGDYIYFNTTNNISISGVPKDGKMTQAKASQSDINQMYYIEFDDTCGTAYIQHVATEQYIGYSGIKMALQKSPWLVWHEGCYTAFYTYVNSKKYILWPEIYANELDYAGLFQTDDVTAAKTALLPAATSRDEPIYTCHPEKGLSVPQIHSDSHERIIPFGIYEIHIINGKKYLRLRN